jgi:hypothetical protein
MLGEAPQNTAKERKKNFRPSSLYENEKENWGILNNKKFM